MKDNVEASEDSNEGTKDTHERPQSRQKVQTSQKHTYMILTSLNPTFIL